MLPTTEVKTHAVSFRDSNEAIYVTNDVAAKLSKFRNHPSSVSFPLVNSTTGTLIRDIGKYEIKSIHEIKKEDRGIGDTSGMHWRCDYNTAHYMHESTCSCSDSYYCDEMKVRMPIQFLEWCRGQFPKVRLLHAYDITQLMKETFLKEKTLITNQK